MKRLVLAFAVLAPAAAQAQQQEIHRALIQRDQMTAEFAAQLRGGQDVRPLQALHAQQLREALVPLSSDPGLAQSLLPYQRGRMEQERAAIHELRFAAPLVRSEMQKPLALPGGPQAGVDPVAPDRLAR